MWKKQLLIFYDVLGKEQLHVQSNAAGAKTQKNKHLI